MANMVLLELLVTSISGYIIYFVDDDDDNDAFAYLTVDMFEWDVLVE